MPGGTLRCACAIVLGVLLLLPSGSWSAPALGAASRCSNCVVDTIPIPGVELPTSITFDPSSGQLFIPDCEALSECSVIAINGTTGGSARTIPTGEPLLGMAYDPITRDLYSPTEINNSESAVAVFNGRTDSIVGAIVAPISALYGWVDIAFDPAHGDLDVASMNGNLTVVNGTSDQYVATFSSHSEGWEMADTPAGGVFVVAPHDLPSQFNVTEVDGSTGDRSPVLTFDGDPLAATYDSEDDRIEITARNIVSDPCCEGELVSIDAGTNGVVSITDAGDGPIALAYDPDNDDLYVSDASANNVTVLDGATGLPVGWIGTDPTPAGIAFDSSNGCLYVLTYAGSASGGGNPDEVSVISPPGGSCPAAPTPIEYTLYAEIVAVILVAVVVVVAVLLVTRRKRASPPAPTTVPPANAASTGKLP